MATQPGTNFSDILLGFERTLYLETLADLGRKTNLVPVQVVACITDIRGFTRLVQEDQKHGKQIAAEFLRDFFRIFPQAVLREAWDLEPADPKQEVTSFQKCVREKIIPRLTKRLGDGVLLVWELDGAAGQEIDQGARYAILDIVGYVQEYFYALLRKTRRVHPKRDFDFLDLGVGLAAGPALRHDYVLGGQVDYSGAPLNLAARLQAEARPSGVCVDADYESLYLLERVWNKEGEIKEVRLAGLVDPISAWFCLGEPGQPTKPKPLKLRRTRKLQTDDFGALRNLLDEPYVERRKYGSDEVRRPLYPDDLRTLLRLREDMEASFALKAAIRGAGKAANKLDPHIKKMKAMTKSSAPDAAQQFRRSGQRFHEAIGFLSGANREEARKNSDVVRRLHECTTKNNYPNASTSLKEMLDEHCHIASAIKNGEAELAKDLMRDHLEKHHERVRMQAFSLKAE